MDDDPLNVIQQMVIQAATQCTDPDLLDLVYRLIVYESGGGS